MNKTGMIASTLVAAMLVSGCSTNPETGNYEITRTGIGLAVGTAAGAAIGAAMGDGRYAIKGAMIGAALGGGTGYMLDRKHKQLREELKATQMKVSLADGGQGEQVLTITTPADVTFAPGSADISAQAFDGLSTLARSLQGQKARIEITGHSDNLGTYDFNQRLSYARAQAVGEYLYQGGVPADSIQIRGDAFSQPIASNETEEGRAQNRRVEIAVRPI